MKFLYLLATLQALSMCLSNAMTQHKDLRALLSDVYDQQPFDYNSTCNFKSYEEKFNEIQYE